MTIEQIRATCIDASKIYYNHLDKNNKGVYNINIRSIEKVKNDKLKLKITSKIFDEETLVFKHLATGKEWSIENIKIQVYDRDTNTLIIKPNTDVYEKMAAANVNDWAIVSDLKFLIERVRQWYERNGKDLKLPERASDLKPPRSDVFFNDDLPSEEQLRALKNIFTNPLSYIWGAPGTGKTQFVLSYAILHYLANKKKVAIVAPTNHALEQIYRGVIKMTDKAGIDREQILRLGGPSKKFADDFPEVCEIIGLENQLKQINKQIDILENILGIDEFSHEEETLRNALNVAQEIIDYIPVTKRIEEQYQQGLSQIDQTNLNVHGLELKIRNLQKEQDILRKKRDSFLYSIAKAFGKKRNYTREIDKLLWDEATVGVDLKKTVLNKEDAIDKAKQNRTLQKETEIALNKLHQNLNSELSKTEVDNSKKTTDIDEIKTLVQNRLTKIENERPVFETLAAEYQHLDNGTVQANYERLKLERSRLENYSTEQRLKNVSIVGATLDTYLYRFKEEQLNVDHIFLDEAGYSNIIKALTLFNQDVPVSFLGDHMQLPPVCEISKRDIQNNETYRPVMVWDQSAIFLEDLFEQDDLNPIVERYLNNANASFNLLKKENLTGTFRFGNSLASVLQTFVYPEGFNSRRTDETEIIVYHVHNLPKFRNGTRKNLSEVNAITSLIKSNFTPDDSVAILAPYTAQVRAIGNELPAYLQNNKVLTVHKSQGQEWATVIYSVCDIGNGKQPWFTDSQNPLSNGLNNINTAISRTKKTLIIVCDSLAWKEREGQLITGVLKAATRHVDFENIV